MPSDRSYISFSILCSKREIHWTLSLWTYQTHCFGDIDACSFFWNFVLAPRMNIIGTVWFGIPLCYGFETYEVLLNPQTFYPLTVLRRCFGWSHNDGRPHSATKWLENFRLERMRNQNPVVDKICKIVSKIHVSIDRILFSLYPVTPFVLTFLFSGTSWNPAHLSRVTRIFPW